jgi:hypothetical protein
MNDQDFRDLVGRAKDTIKHDVDPDGSLDSQAETMADFCRKEILAAVTSAEGVLSMAVARLGGLVEGRPTARHNFLQRIDELRQLENSPYRIRSLQLQARQNPAESFVVECEAASRPSELGSHGEANLPRDAAENRPEDCSTALTLEKAATPAK